MTNPTTSAGAPGAPGAQAPGTAPAPVARILIDALSRSRERLARALEGVDAAAANARPVGELAPRVDSLTWLAWHTAREIDLQVAAIEGRPPLWVSAGHSARFNLPLPDDTQDWHHTPEQSAQVTVADMALLTSYLDDVYADATRFLTALDASRLEEVIDDSWDPPVTLATRLVSIIDDAAAHSGQAMDARRLAGLPG